MSNDLENQYTEAVLDEAAAQSFSISNDSAADWALRKIKDETDEANRLVALADQQIEELEGKKRAILDQLRNRTGFLKYCLASYFHTVPHKETKTQETYKLLSGSLVFKKPSVKINHDDEQLIKSLDGTEFVETKKSLKWGEYKKQLVVYPDGNIVDTNTGEIVTGCTVEDVPGEFNVKF